MSASIPSIIVWGGRNARDYGDPEIDATLWRTFQGNPDAFLVLDSYPQGQRFKAACACWGIAKGFLYVDQVVDRGQGEVCSVGLSEAGKARYCASYGEAAQ